MTLDIASGFWGSLRTFMKHGFPQAFLLMQSYMRDRCKSHVRFTSVFEVALEGQAPIVSTRAGLCNLLSAANLPVSGIAWSELGIFQ